MRRWGFVLALVLVSGCRLVPQGTEPVGTVPPPESPIVSNAALAGVARGPAPAGLGFSASDAASALASFRESCPRLLSRTDASGLTTVDDWRPACAAAAGWPASRAGEFFTTHFGTVRVGEGTAFATGYYEPEIAGSRTRLPGYDVPVYGMPPDLVRGWPDEIVESERTGRPPLGRYDASGKFVPYYDRAEIDAGALANRGLEIAWAADPVEFFFLQIQGSGRLRAPDGSVMRIGYAGQNGREYVGLGSIMRQRGLIGSAPGQYSGSLEGIQQFLRDRPAEGRDMLRANASYVFFREITGEGPVGALGVPVKARSTVAADPTFVPLGAPVFLSTDTRAANGLWVAQDTGGAIKGTNRFDTFWGAGPEARATAGGMTARGQALLLLPKGTLARLGVR
jgi:membrane-bound lytic murein transglycosylase A